MAEVPELLYEATVKNPCRWLRSLLADRHEFSFAAMEKSHGSTNLNQFLKLFVFLVGCSFLFGAAGYFILWLIMPEGWVFGALYRMFCYHWEHPLQYIALMSLIYSTVATFVILLPDDPVGKWPCVTIPLIMLASIALASPVGGVLWAIHDMQAGYFPDGIRFWNALIWGALEGISSGWLIILTSVPYNILGVIVGYQVTLRGYRMTPRYKAKVTYEPTNDFQTLAALRKKLSGKRS